MQRQRAAGRRPLVGNRDGAAGVYIAVISAVMVGMVGLALDFGRYDIVNTQAQNAADAAAQAAASQLDGTSNATARAYNAAQASTGLVTNTQRLSDPVGNVTIAAVDFLAALPASDKTAIDSSNILCSGTSCTAAQSAQARFVQVTTQRLTHQNWFIPVVGASSTSSTLAIAVAGNTKLICRIPPLFACNPDETSTNKHFNVDNWVGKEIVLKSGPSNGCTNQWAPGNWGLLQSQLPNCSGLATKCIQDQIAFVTPDEPCVGTTVLVKPGVVNGMREAMNTRFDMWENPGFQGQQLNPAYAPAPDTIKGMVTNSQCSAWAPPAGPAQKIPRDTSFSCPNGACSCSTPFGNGTWDCLTYWTVNHPPPNGPSNPASPTWCTHTTDATGGNFATQSRFAMYQNEISSGIIPNNSSNGTNQNGEDGRVPGNPQCARAADTADGANRRIIYFALVNCQQNAGLLNGNSGGPIPTVDNGTFVKAFVTEPVLNPSSQETDIVIEVDGVAKQGDGVLHDIVQLYR